MQVQQFKKSKEELQKEADKKQKELDDLKKELNKPVDSTRYQYKKTSGSLEAPAKEKSQPEAKKQ
jgi:response regulator of citrate/malate metabolism